MDTASQYTASNLTTTPDNIPQVINVCVVCDRVDKTKRRVCLWPDFLKELTTLSLNIQLVSIADEICSKNPASFLFDKTQTDIIILNWNVINGDPVYTSNISQMFFHHYIWDLEHWVSEGGVVVVEAQTGSSELIQEAYNIFTLRDRFWVKCLPFPQSHRGTKPRLNRRLVDIHPFLNFHESRPNNLVSTIPVLPDFDLVDQQYSPNTILSLQRADIHKLGSYNGWFTRISPEWEVIVEADTPLFTRRRPILIARLSGDRTKGTGGAVVLSTMYLSLLKPEQLMTAILAPRTNLAEYIFDMKKTRRIFWLWTVLSVFVFFSALVLGMFLLKNILAAFAISALAGLFVEALKLLIQEYKTFFGRIIR